MQGLMWRAYTQLGDDSQAQQWQAKSVELLTARRRLAALLDEARNNPQSPRSGLIAAYQAALDQDWDAARGALAALLRQAPLLYDEPFVQQLIEAVRQRSAPPALESLPDY